MCKLLLYTCKVTEMVDLEDLDYMNKEDLKYIMILTKFLYFLFIFDSSFKAYAFWQLKINFKKRDIQDCIYGKGHGKD